MLRKFLAVIMGTPVNANNQTAPHQLSAHKQTLKERSLIRREAKIGAEVLGAIPSGHSREFFCLDATTWIWHEQWKDPETKQSQAMYVKYEFQPRGVLKTVNGVAKGYVIGQELSRLVDAISLYHKRVSTEIYGRTPVASIA